MQTNSAQACPIARVRSWQLSHTNKTGFSLSSVCYSLHSLQATAYHFVDQQNIRTARHARIGHAADVAATGIVHIWCHIVRVSEATAFVLEIVVAAAAAVVHVLLLLLLVVIVVPLAATAATRRIVAAAIVIRPIATVVVVAAAAAVIVTKVVDKTTVIL